MTAAKASRTSSALRRFGSGGVTMTGDCGCVVMTLPGSSFPVPVVGEAAQSRWAGARAAAKAVGEPAGGGRGARGRGRAGRGGGRRGGGGGGRGGGGRGRGPWLGSPAQGFHRRIREYPD